MIFGLGRSAAKVHYSSDSPGRLEIRRINSAVMAGCVKFSVLSLLIIFGASGVFASNYETAFRKGLEEEAAQNWSAAIQNYLLAREADPTKSFPEQRIRSIFSDLLQKGESINSLRVLLPKDLDESFDRQGLYDLQKKADEGLDPWFNFLMWAVIVLAAAGAGFYLFQYVRRQDRAVEAEAEVKIEENAKAQQRAKSRLTTEHRKTAQTTLTDKTREELQGMLSSVQSLTGEMNRPDGLQFEDKEQMDRLKDSGVIQALAETLLSEVQVDQTDKGKYSKLTLDASLFFDESDVDFFEKEFGKMNSDSDKGPT